MVVSPTHDDYPENLLRQLKLYQTEELFYCERETGALNCSIYQLPVPFLNKKNNYCLKLQT